MFEAFRARDSPPPKNEPNSEELLTVEQVAKNPGHREGVDPAELKARLGKILKDNGVPGMAAVIADRDGIAWTAGIGLADVATRMPATPDALLRVASISKTFVALAALKLNEEAGSTWRPR